MPNLLKSLRASYALMLFLLVAFALPLAGCRKRGEAKVENAAGCTLDCIERYEGYVRSDGALAEAERAVRLANAGTVRERFEAAEASGAKKINLAALSEPLKAILPVHDAYVTGDVRLSALERRLYLRDSELAFGMLTDALGGKKAQPPPAEPQSSAKPYITNAENGAITYGDPLPKPKDAD